MTTTLLGREYKTINSRYESNGITDQYDRNTLLSDCVGRGKNVLELGCSTGYVSALLQNAKCKVFAIELDPSAADSARRFCEQVVIMDLSQEGWEHKLATQSFDVIVMGDVLEHLVDPDSVLRRVVSLLGPGGQVVISLPNIVHWTQRLKGLFGKFEYKHTGLLDHTHLRFFTLGSARAMIETAGYRIIRFQPVIGGKLSEHLRGCWQVLARMFPSLFAFQLLFVAEPVT